MQLLRSVLQWRQHNTNPPSTQDAWCVTLRKWVFFCCCFSLLYEHTTWQQLFPFVALCHADVTLRFTRSVWTRGNMTSFGYPGFQPCTPGIEDGSAQNAHTTKHNPNSHNRRSCKNRKVSFHQTPHSNLVFLFCTWSTQVKLVCAETPSTRNYRTYNWKRLQSENVTMRKFPSSNKRTQWGKAEDLKTSGPTKYFMRVSARGLESLPFGTLQLGLSLGEDWRVLGFQVHALCPVSLLRPREVVLQNFPMSDWHSVFTLGNDEDNSTTTQNWTWSAILKKSFFWATTTEADLGFWSGSPQQSFDPRRAWGQNLLKIRVFPLNLKTSWGLGPPGSASEPTDTLRRWTEVIGQWQFLLSYGV